MAISGRLCFVILASALSCVFSSHFPYTISISNDGPVLLDTPITINVTLIPISSKCSLPALPRTNSSLTPNTTSPPCPPQKKYFFHWIDNRSTFDCPHRLSRVQPLSPLSSVYIVTYHHQWLRCPPAFNLNGKRTVGVAIYDHADFDPEWSIPLAMANTSIHLNTEIDMFLMARPMIFDVPTDPDPNGEDFFLAGWGMAVNVLYSDPNRTIRDGNGSYYWSLSPPPKPPNPPFPYDKDLGSAMLYTFEEAGRYRWGVDFEVTLEMPEYSGRPKTAEMRNFTKRASAKRTFVVMEKVKNLRLSMKEEATVGEPWTLGISLNGTFPIFVNWSIEFIHHGLESNGSSDPRTIVGNKSCLYKNRHHVPIESDDDDDLIPRVCRLPIKFNFTQEGAYRVTVYGFNEALRLNRNYVHLSRYLWVYPPEETVALFTFVLPFLFIAFGLGCCIFTYVQYSHFHEWGQQSVEIADFEVSFSYENESGARVRQRRSWRRWIREACDNWTEWIGSHGFCKSSRRGRYEYPSPEIDPTEKTGLTKNHKSTGFRRARSSNGYIALTSTTDTSEPEVQSYSGIRDIDFQKTAMQEIFESDTATDGDDEEHEIDDQDLEFYQQRSDLVQYFQQRSYQNSPPRPNA